MWGRQSQSLSVSGHMSMYTRPWCMLTGIWYPSSVRSHWWPPTYCKQSSKDTWFHSICGDECMVVSSSTRASGKGKEGIYNPVENIANSVIFWCKFQQI
jgi:hypothetical protein